MAAPAQLHCRAWLLIVLVATREVHALRADVSLDYLAREAASKLHAETVAPTVASRSMTKSSLTEILEFRTQPNASAIGDSVAGGRIPLLSFIRGRVHERFFGAPPLCRKVKEEMTEEMTEMKDIARESDLLKNLQQTAGQMLGDAATLGTSDPERGEIANRFNAIYRLIMRLYPCWEVAQTGLLNGQPVSSNFMQFLNHGSTLDGHVNMMCEKHKTSDSCLHKLIQDAIKFEKTIAFSYQPIQEYLKNSNCMLNRDPTPLVKMFEEDPGCESPKCNETKLSESQVQREKEERKKQEVNECREQDRSPALGSGTAWTICGYCCRPPTRKRHVLGSTQTGCVKNCTRSGLNEHDVEMSIRIGKVMDEWFDQDDLTKCNYSLSWHGLYPAAQFRVFLEEKLKGYAAEKRAFGEDGNIPEEFLGEGGAVEEVPSEGGIPKEALSEDGELLSEMIFKGFLESDAGDQVLENVDSYDEALPTSFLEEDVSINSMSTYVPTFTEFVLIIIAVIFLILLVVCVVFSVTKEVERFQRHGGFGGMKRRLRRWWREWREDW